MAKYSRHKRTYRKNASKLHKAVGDVIFSTAFLKNLRIYQEYPAKQLFSEFKSYREKYDWVILDLQIIVECHGLQHYKPVRFGGITEEEARQRFIEQVRRDRLKQQIAEKHGWKYVVIKYDDDLSPDKIIEKILGG